MRRVTRISIAVWLPISVGLLIAACVWVASSVMHNQSVSALQSRAEDVAAGRSLRAALAIRRDIENGIPVRTAVSSAERDQALTILLLDAAGHPLVNPTDAEDLLMRQEQTPEAVASLVTHSRWIDTSSEHSIGVGLHLNVPADSVMIARASRAALGSELSILSEARRLTLKIVLPVSIIAGALLALLTALRLRRVTQSTRVLASGSFETPVTSRFPDEIGELSQSLNDMRLRLSDLFTQVQSERARLERLLARLQQGVVAVERDGRIAYANEAAARVMKLSDFGRGDELPEVSDELSLRELASRLFDADAALTRVVVPVAAERVLEVVGIPPMTDSDDLATLVLTDLTEVERQEQAEREFVANAAHQLRTPLATIRGSVDLLLADPPPPPDVRERFLTHIRREADRLNGLSRALLILAKAEAADASPPLEPTPLQPILRSAADAVEPSPGVLLHIPADSSIEVWTNPELLEHALVNLLANAATHTDSGNITVEASAEGPVCTIVVSDTGSGIAPDDREHVVDRFYRGAGVTSDGFGLGLAIVRAAVDAVGGELAIASTPGHGTTVTMTLPITPRTATADKALTRT